MKIQDKRQFTRFSLIHESGFYCNKCLTKMVYSYERQEIVGDLVITFKCPNCGATKKARVKFDGEYNWE